MSGSPTGIVPLRKDGTPCVHEYHKLSNGPDYTLYVCKHCNYSYSVDLRD